MSDDELLDALHDLGKFLVGLGVGPRPADMITLEGAALAQVARVWSQLMTRKAGRLYGREHPGECSRRN